jgi:hypothetical protein
MTHPKEKPYKIYNSLELYSAPESVCHKTPKSILSLHCLLLWKEASHAKGRQCISIKILSYLNVHVTYTSTRLWHTRQSKMATTNLRRRSVGLWIISTLLVLASIFVTALSDLGYNGLSASQAVCGSSCSSPGQPYTPNGCNSKYRCVS